MTKTETHSSLVDDALIAQRDEQIDALKQKLSEALLDYQHTITQKDDQIKALELKISTDSAALKLLSEQQQQNELQIRAQQLQLSEQRSEFQKRFKQQLEQQQLERQQLEQQQLEQQQQEPHHIDCDHQRLQPRPDENLEVGELQIKLNATLEKLKDSQNAVDALARMIHTPGLLPSLLGFMYLDGHSKMFLCLFMMYISLHIYVSLFLFFFIHLCVSSCLDVCFKIYLLEKIQVPKFCNFYIYFSYRDFSSYRSCIS